MSIEKTPFDVEIHASDPYQIACEHYRTGVLRLAQEASQITVMRDLDANHTLSAIIMGTLTGSLTSCFALAGIKPEVRKTIIDGLVASIPFATEQAVGIVEDFHRQHRR